ncbi:GDSL-type esterase/lipase family protein [Flavobacterium pectinovorum]|uniref:SGNH/GDSL hydrolase family protein n=1 Tax=Flavobacterium pectinovorum TaxID=29533 RepID=A0A502EVP6_9FLAO|nr:GDSL-type esterase/lipase family protein [Flavobacterium pectinovorum]TPG42005.1 SGNH/GDSL hydrolase family protein [Flavobacterium pectinovorum]
MTKKKYGVRTVNGNQPDPETGNVNVSSGGSQDLEQTLANGNTVGEGYNIQLHGSNNTSSIQNDGIFFFDYGTGNSSIVNAKYYKSELTQDVSGTLYNTRNFSKYNGNELVYREFNTSDPALSYTLNITLAKNGLPLGNNNVNIEWPVLPDGNYTVATKDQLVAHTLQETVTAGNTITNGTTIVNRYGENDKVEIGFSSLQVHGENDRLVQLDARALLFQKGGQRAVIYGEGGNGTYFLQTKDNGNYDLATTKDFQILVENCRVIRDTSIEIDNTTTGETTDFNPSGILSTTSDGKYLQHKVAGIYSGDFNTGIGNNLRFNNRTASGFANYDFPENKPAGTYKIATTDDLLDATDSTKGLVSLNGDLGGTADAPTVPALSGKQATLVSGTNIKTINGTSLLGSGNLSVGNSLKSFSIFDDNFEDGTASLTLSDGWSVGSDGIAISSSGGWGNSALLNKYTTIDQVSSRALVQIINTASVFSLIRKPTTLNQFGTVAQVDCSTSMLKIYASWDGSTTIPTVAKSISIPFSIVANRKYLLELKKNKAFTTFTFTDTTNLNNTISLTYNQETETISGIGRQWGAPGVMFNSGNIKLKRFTYSSEFPNAPKVLVTGHSFVEGYALYAEGDSGKTYSNLLFNSLNGDVAIAGRGGEDISTINTRNDIDFFSPTYHLVDIGSNDTVYATWLAGIQTYISKIQASGAIPVLATIVPRSDRQTFINQANDWIRLGAYNYVDFAKAVTVSNDGLTQDVSLFWTDSVHPNIAGNAKMFQQLKIDAPYLWDGYTKPQIAVVNLDITEVSKIASFTVSLTDSGKLYVINSSSAVVVTFPTGITAGKWWEFISIGTGAVSFVAGSNATLISPDNRLKLRAQYSQARILARALNQGALGGDIIL